MISNNLTIIEKIFNKGSHTRYKCICICGKEFTPRASHVDRGTTTSCGCVRTMLTKQRQWKGYGDISMSLWTHIKESAKKRNIFFNITIKECWNLFLNQNRKCNISNIELYFPLTYENRLKGEFTASLDRIDSSKGYTIDNIQWVHKDINKMKLDYSQEYFISLCNLIAQNNIRNNIDLNSIKRK